MFDALSKGNDPDRMKGALYVLWNKSTGTYFLPWTGPAQADKDIAAYALGGKLL